MKKTLMTAMKNSISEVMETMFFLPVEFRGETSLGGAGIGQEFVGSCIRFTGDVGGVMMLFAPRDLVGEMGENFMGESRDHLTEDHLSGTLTEMLNMVCGNALSKIGSKEPFELGIPQVLKHLEIPETESVGIVETMSGRMGFYLALD